jgi:hypothetical protein
MKSINDIEKKKGRGRPATDATPVLVRVLPEQLANVDRWIAKQKGEALSRPEALRRLVEIGLKAKAAK